MGIDRQRPIPTLALPLKGRGIIFEMASSKGTGLRLPPLRGKAGMGGYGVGAFVAARFTCSFL